MTILPATLLLPQQTISKPGAVLSLVKEASAFGANGILVHDAFLKRSGKLDAILSGYPIRTWQHAGGEPTVGAVEDLRAEIRRERPDWVATVGGGSVIDLGKAAAGLADAPETAAFYQLNNAAIPPAVIPFIAAPTTAGTGAEATVTAVLTDPARTLKQSIRHPSFMPKCVILDPCLLEGCPKATIAAAGLDAFIQAFESYTSRHATPFTRALSELALVRISHALLPLYQGDPRFAADMLEASNLAGIALSHARLGVIHGLAHPLGVRFHAAHGLTCACCLPTAMAFNREAIAADLAGLKARHGIDVEAQIDQWLGAMALDNPFKGQRVDDREAFIRETLASGSTAANPRPVTAEDAAALLDAVLKD
ncbi:MAG: iron-containing alcohol dehydrogenase [Kiritimatiellaeota bacterium]|nr:iron-containing alcohol dehydrogenase [Kiritimatiellota bacterium]